jgi:hypothetical protein
MSLATIEEKILVVSLDHLLLFIGDESKVVYKSVKFVYDKIKYFGKMVLKTK